MSDDVEGQVLAPLCRSWIGLPCSARQTRATVESDQKCVSPGRSDFRLYISVFYGLTRGETSRQSESSCAYFW